MYCGDETGSFIGEIASNSSRFGYGGEDAPKCVIPSYMYADGTIPSSTLNLHRISSSNLSMEKLVRSDVKIKSIELQSSGTNFFEDIVPIFDVPPYSSCDNDCDPDSYLNDGIIVNFDAWENSWLYAFDRLRFWDLSKHATGESNVKKLHRVRDFQTLSKSDYKHTSTLLSSSSIEEDGVRGRSNKVIHPILAIDSGNTYFQKNVIMEEKNENNGFHYNNAIRRKQRAFMTEILFETINSPAAFIAPGPMLTAFANGRQTALIVDVGAGGTRITPVVDGLLLENSQRRNGRGGEWLCAVQRRALEEIILNNNSNYVSNINTAHSAKTQNSLSLIHPRYAVKRFSSKGHILDEKKSKFQVYYPLNGVTKKSIFHRIATRDAMYEMITGSHMKGVSKHRDKKWTVPFLYSSMKKIDGEENINIELNDFLRGNNFVNNKVTDIHNMHLQSFTNYDILSRLKPAENDFETNGVTFYELPDGTHVDLTKNQYSRDLCRLPELLFAQDLPFIQKSEVSIEDRKYRNPAEMTLASLPMHYLAKESLRAVLDADVRKELCGNIILAGGTSLIPMLDQRFSVEMNDIVSSLYKCKVIASRNTIERRYASWIGGSILTSLGSFQQLWMSKNEYEEYGVLLALQRFP